jgi:hypothetical protein
MTFAYGSLERPVVAPSVQESNLICARVNLQRLKLIAQVKPLKSDGLPPEDSVYNKGSQMLKADLSGLAIQLRPRGKRKLIISGMAAHLGFLARQDQLRMDEFRGLSNWVAWAPLPSMPKHISPINCLSALEGTKPLRFGVLTSKSDSPPPGFDTGDDETEITANDALRHQFPLPRDGLFQHCIMYSIGNIKPVNTLPIKQQVDQCASQRSVFHNIKVFVDHGMQLP